MRERAMFVVAGFAAAGLFVTTVSTSGCSSGTTVVSGASDAAAEASPGSEYATAAAVIGDAVCEFQARCTRSGLVAAYGTVEACKKRRRDTIVPSTPGVALTVTQAERCAAGLATLDCRLADQAAFPPECGVKGTLEDGASCDLNGQCASGSCYHANPDSAACGVCQAAAPVGGDCAAADCAFGLYCANTTCAKKVALGGDCNASSKRCIGILDCVQGKCKEPLPPGAACGAVGSATCDVSKEVVCKPTAPTDPAGTCVPFLEAKLGEPCGIDSTKLTFTVCSKGQCMPSETKGTCVAHAADGEPCSTLIPCLAPALCLDKVCTVRDPATCR